LHSSEETTQGLAPDLIAPVIGYRDWRVTEDGLTSPHTGAVWLEHTMHATCLPTRVEDLIRPEHDAPHPGCSCGIHAYYALEDRASKVDYRGVCGVVSLWGRLEAHEDGMRAEWARVEALGVYQRWSRRQTRAVLDVASQLGCDVYDLADLPVVASRYGSELPEIVLPHAAHRRHRPPMTRRSVLVGR
jgi:hypothetical protein